MSCPFLFVVPFGFKSDKLYCFAVYYVHSGCNSVDCLEVKREYYQNCSVLGCVTSCEQFLQVQLIVFVTLRPLCHA